MKKFNVDKAMGYAKASQAMEGLKVSEKQEDLVLDFIKGYISEQEFHKRARKLADE